MQNIIESLKRYNEDRASPGRFLQSILENDLFGAIANADHINIHKIFDTCDYIYNNLPESVWGNHDIVNNHLNEKKNEKFNKF